MTWCLIDHTLVNSSINICIFIVFKVVVWDIRIFKSITVNQRILNTNLRCRWYCKRIDSRACRNVSMIVLVAIDIVVGFRYHLIELIWVELF